MSEEKLTSDQTTIVGAIGAVNVGIPVAAAFLNAAMESTSYYATASSIMGAAKDGFLTTGKYVLALDFGVAAAAVGAIGAVRGCKALINSAKVQRGLERLKRQF